MSTPVHSRRRTTRAPRKAAFGNKMATHFAGPLATRTDGTQPSAAPKMPRPQRSVSRAADQLLISKYYRPDALLRLPGPRLTRLLLSSDLLHVSGWCLLR